jgi:hypothetical protein
MSSINKYDHIIVAVHGIGDQTRNATVRDVATRFARMPGLAKDGIFVAPQPLGYFHTDVTDAVKVSVLGDVVPDAPLSSIGFSEVYWADIPEVVVGEGHTMDETKAWARTIVSRTRAAYHQTRLELEGAKRLRMDAAQRLRIKEPDFTLAAEVLEEIVDTIEVLENLLFLAKKAGIADFELGRMLKQYVGDVQIFTEFKLFRCNIIARFHGAMEQIHRDNPGARLHVVAHSEGTVVSFLGLLYALSGERIVTKGSKDAASDAASGVPGWIAKVAGYLTIGSPIDKHLLLWPELWKQFDFTRSTPLVRDRAIQWRNYYDYGDPVGFELDTAREWLKDINCTAFDFERNDDIGYARYLLPGKAHTDYWTDAAVFEHFVNDVILEQGSAAAPKTRPLVYVIGPMFPYLLSFILLYAASLILHRAVSRFLHPPLEFDQSYALWSNFGTLPSGSPAGMQLYKESLGLALLYGGTTLLARWPRLAKGFTWWAAGAGAFVLGCVGYVTLVPRGSRDAIGSLFQPLGGDVSLWTLAAALLVALIGLTGVSKPGTDLPDGDSVKPDAANAKSLKKTAKACIAKVFNTKVSRRSRWFSRRMRPLVLCGAALIAAIIVVQKPNAPPTLTPKDRVVIVERYVARKLSEFKRQHAGLEMDPATTFALKQDGEERAAQFAALVQARPPVWPVLIAGAAFLYLWWLAALIFDLAFVWQRYIRQGLALKRLATWREIRNQCKPPTEGISRM